MGGFMGATENGQTTTLGRGGSDLTATIVGAAVNAEEIQIWKDVDGILTADPRIKKDALLVKQLSYAEAAALARAGAKVLHPETIAPAQRLRIPITLRNTFNPGAAGSTVSFAATRSNAAKSIICKSNMTLLEISSARSDVSIAECAQAMNDIFDSQNRKMEALGMTDSVLYLALDGAAPHPEFSAPSTACIQAHMRTNQALLTVIGGQSPLVTSVVARFQGLILPGSASEPLLRAVIPNCNLTACLAELHHALFSAADPNVFSKPSPAPLPRRADMHQAQPKDRASRLRHALALAAGAGFALRN
jgi:aspartate kinase